MVVVVVVFILVAVASTNPVFAGTIPLISSPFFPSPLSCVLMFVLKQLV